MQKKVRQRLWGEVTRVIALSLILVACENVIEEPTTVTTAPTITQPSAQTAEPIPALIEEPTEESSKKPVERPIDEPTEEPTPIPLPSIDPSGQTISFWHIWGKGLPYIMMQAIVEAFNASNDWGITVHAIDQGGYSKLEDLFYTAIQSGDLPDLVTGYPNVIANWFAVDAVVDLAEFINDPALGLSAEEQHAYYTGVLDGGKAPDGTQFAFPINQSMNVLFYNSGWARELGFSVPPANYEELKEQACTAAEANNNDDNPKNDWTGGLVLYTSASNVASFVFANGGNMLNADGRGYDFTDPAVQDVAVMLKDLWDSKCAFATKTYPNPEFATRKALFTMSSTAGLPYQLAAFETEDAIKDEWTLIPFPGKEAGQAVNLFGQYVAIANTTPERMMATWVFVRYLTSPEVQAKWIMGSGYYPTRTDALPFLESYGQENELWSRGLSFLEIGKAEPAWASWTSLRYEVSNIFKTILQGTPEDIPALLEELNILARQAFEDSQ